MYKYNQANETKWALTDPSCYKYQCLYSTTDEFTVFFKHFASMEVSSIGSTGIQIRGTGFLGDMNDDGRCFPESGGDSLNIE